MRTLAICACGFQGMLVNPITYAKKINGVLELPLIL